MTTMEAYVGIMEARLKKWAARLDALALEAGRTKTQSKAELKKHVEELWAKHRAVETKLDELRAAGTEQWQALKGSVHATWRELGVAYRKLTN